MDFLTCYSCSHYSSMIYSLNFVLVFIPMLKNIMSQIETNFIPVHSYISWFISRPQQFESLPDISKKLFLPFLKQPIISKKA